MILGYVRTGEKVFLGNELTKNVSGSFNPS